LTAEADQLVLGGWSSPYIEYIEKMVVSDDARCSSAVENLGDCGCEGVEDGDPGDFA
jgi:hypothetical protein